MSKKKKTVRLKLLAAGETSAPEVHSLGDLSARLAETDTGGVSFTLFETETQAPFYKSILTSAEDVQTAVRIAGDMLHARKTEPDLAWPTLPDVPIDLASYDVFIVAFSGGKDSVACVLYLLYLGVPPSKIELWHHDIDGREGSSMMDWPVTRDYCRAFAKALGIPIYFSWKKGGFEGEMDRNGVPTAESFFETPDGLRSGGGKGKPGTRGVFPQVSPDLTVRWCSAYLKIGVGAMAVANQKRFNGLRTLFLTGERGEESSARAKYAKLEPHRADLRNGRKVKRYVDQWRPIIGWREHAVWAIIARYRVNVHPAYKVGWSRVSCDGCIFGNADQFASLRAINPRKFAYLVEKERQSGKTIKHKVNLTDLANNGTPYTMNPSDVASVISETFDEPIILDSWTLPSGAFGDSAGPT